MAAKKAPAKKVEVAPQQEVVAQVATQPKNNQQNQVGKLKIEYII